MLIEAVRFVLVRSAKYPSGSSDVVICRSRDIMFALDDDGNDDNDDGVYLVFTSDCQIGYAYKSAFRVIGC